MSAGEKLDRLASLAGIAVEWIDWRGTPRRVPEPALRALLAALGLPADTPDALADSLARAGFEAAESTLPPLLVATVGEPVALGAAAAAGAAYRLALEDGRVIAGVLALDAHGRAALPAVAEPGYHTLDVGAQRCTLAVAPARAFTVADLGRGERLWGLAAQLYSLRRAGDGGIGDFSALAELARAAAARGADALAVSPVHALFSADVARYSPYSPSSRLFVNVLHADPAAVFGAAAVEAARVALGVDQAARALEALPLIDWPAAARIKLAVARRLFSSLAGAPLAAFERWLRDAGTALRDHARFEALHAHFLAATPARWNWRDWPAEYRDVASTAVERFAAAQAGEVRFHAFLQWLADRGLAAAQAVARDAGMAIGLIGDLAVGADGGGSQAWSARADLLLGVSIGAPPDPLALLGQSWGLTAFSPRALRRRGYAPFLDMLRAQLRHAGGLRIDHVLGLNRLWLVPDGAKATEGAYLRYPLAELLALIRLESWRHRAVIIGEDMGTVPAGFREQLAASGVLGIRVLWFERDWGLFVEPARWTPLAAAATTTHDLPTVAGWWKGRDIDWRARLALYGEGHDEAGDRAARAGDRVKLWAALTHAGVAGGAMPDEAGAAAVVDAACAFIAKTPSPLALLPVEDVLGLDEAPNLPGTIDEHPNWRRRLPGESAAMLDAPPVAVRLERLAGIRPRSATD